MPFTQAARRARNPVLTDAQYFERYKSRTIVDENGCWLWQGFVHKTGYGDTAYRGKNMKAHRAMFIVAKEPVPDGLNVLHTCDVRNCINPDHLWLGTISDNKQDELAKGRNYEANRTHCPKGHSYAEHGIRHGRNAWRVCALCVRAKCRRQLGWPEELWFAPLGTKWHRKWKP